MYIFCVTIVFAETALWAGASSSLYACTGLRRLWKQLLWPTFLVNRHQRPCGSRSSLLLWSTVNTHKKGFACIPAWTKLLYKCKLKAGPRLIITSKGTQILPSFPILILLQEYKDTNVKISFLFHFIWGSFLYF